MLSVFVWGQNQPKVTYTVTGTVTDSLTQEHEPYATIRIYKHPDLKKAAALLVSDNEGNFSASLKETGHYRLVITSVGLKEWTKDFQVTAPVTRLGTIRMAEDINQLNEIAVVAKKPLVKVEMDKIAYDVDEDPDSETKTVLDMMRKVPMITVDGEDNISLAGKEGFKIYVNGKPNTLMTNNPKEVLKSMPASSVKNIEVITNPGAKYDAEGVGGIINIVTTGKAIEGYSINLSGSYTTNHGFGGSLFGTTQIGKLTVSGGYNYNQFNSFPNRSDGTIDYYHSDQTASVYNQTDDSRYNGHFSNVFLDASYEIDSLNLISMSGAYFSVEHGYSNHGFTQAFDRKGNETYYYDHENWGDMTYGGGNLSVDYQHTSPRNKQQTFVLSYRLNGNPVSTHTIQRLFNTRNFAAYEQNLDNHGTSLENTVQADYTLPFGQIHTLNFGAKYINRINDSDNQELHRNSSDDPWEVFDREGSGQTRHRQHVAGIYAEYNLRYRKLGLKGGLRYEYTRQDVAFERYHEQDFSTDFSDLVPSLLLSYNLATTCNLTLGYNMRISRPGIFLLNPFRNNSESQLYVQYGNPQLDSEHYHTLTFGFGTFSPNFSLNINPEYSFCNDGILQYSFLDDRQVINQTYANIGRQHVAGLNLFVSWNPSGSTRLMLNGNGRHTWLSNNDQDGRYGMAGDKNRGFSYNFYGNAQQNLPWKLNLSLYGGYGSGNITLTTVQPFRYYFYGLQLQRSFLKEDRLTVSANASNFLPKYMAVTTISESDQYRSVNHSYNRNFNYSITVSYKIGNFKSAVKKAVRSIQNTDVTGGENRSGQSGQGGGMK